MTWDALAAIAGTVAAFAVALTVVYLAIQVRRNTLATRSQTYYLATNALAEAAALIGTDPQVTRIYRIGLTNPDDLTDNERMQFALLCVSQFRRYENLYFQYRTGLVERISGTAIGRTSCGSSIAPVCRRGGKNGDSRSARAFANTLKARAPVTSSPRVIAGSSLLDVAAEPARAANLRRRASPAFSGRQGAALAVSMPQC
jgi:hypothetical protein